MKRLQIPQELVCEKFYVHEIAAVNLWSYLLKNAKKTCKPNNRDWKSKKPHSLLHNTTKLTFTCSKSTIETVEKGVKYVQS